MDHEPDRDYRLRSVRIYVEAATLDDLPLTALEWAAPAFQARKVNGTWVTPLGRYLAPYILDVAVVETDEIRDALDRFMSRRHVVHANFRVKEFDFTSPYETDQARTDWLRAGVTTT